MRRILVVFACLLTFAATSLAQNIHTVAGGAVPNNVPATSIGLVVPYGAVVDSAGNFYFTAGLDCVFKVAPSGTLTVVAGNGIRGFSGDGGPATSASLYNPEGLAVDAAGNLYIADSTNNRIRKVDPSGIITTVAGNGTYGYSGDGGPATSASLYNPHGVAVDGSGNIYIADTYNQVIRKVDASTHDITTVAGSGSSGFGGDGKVATDSTVKLLFPTDVALDTSNNLYIVDSLNYRIREVDHSTQVITTVAGTGSVGYSGDGGLAVNATLDYPQGVAVDGSGNFYIADYQNSAIRMVSVSTHKISTVAGNGTFGFSGDGGPATTANLDYPQAVAVDGSGNLYITDTGNQRVRKVTYATHDISTLAGNGGGGFYGEGGPGTSAGMTSPSDLATDSAGNVYIVDAPDARILKWDASTHIISTVAGNGVGGCYGTCGDGGPATSASFGYPGGVAVDGLRNIYIADEVNNDVRMVDASTHDISTVTSAFEPTGVAVDTAGNLYFAGPGSNYIQEYDATTHALSIVAGSYTRGYSGDNGLATAAELNSPEGVAVDSDGNLYIADTGNNCIRRVDHTTQIITTVAGNGTYGFGGDGGPATSANLGEPMHVAVDSLGNLYIADWGNNRIRKVDHATQIITTVAGNGTYGFSGDEGPAIDAMLANPSGVAVDSAGNIFLGDTNNGRVRRVDATVMAPAVTLSATSLDFGHSSVGTQTSTQDITVTNSGSADLHISSVSASGDFLETDGCTTAAITPSNYCTVSVSFLPTATGTRTGTLTITDDAGDSPQTVSLTGTGDPASQTITFGALSNKTYGDSPFVVSATGGASGNPVTFNSTTTGVCTTSGTNGSTVTIIAAGLCSITASQAGNSTYSAAADVVQSFTVSAKALTASIIGNPTKPYDGNANATLTSANYSLGGLVGSDSITVTKTAGAYNSADVAAANTVTVSLAAADFTANGGTLLSNYSLPTSASGPGQIGKAHLTVKADDKSKVYDGSAFTGFTATISGFVNGENGSVVSGTPTFSGSAVGAINAGTYTITPALGSLSAANYDFTAFDDGTLTINRADVTVAFGNVGPFTYNGNPQAPTFAVNGVNSEVLTSSATASYSGAQFDSTAYASAAAPTNGGNYTQTVAFAGNTNYNALNPSATQNFTINKANQAVLSLSVPANITYGNTGDATATGGTGNGALSFLSTGSTGCSVDNSSGVISVNNASGTCSITASKAGDNNYSGPVTDGPKSVALLKADQAALALNTTSPLAYSQSETLSVSGGTTGGTVSYNLGSGSCTIAGNQLTANSGTGSCSLTATMAGNDNYNDVTSTPANTVSLQKADQGTVTVAGPNSVTYGTTGTAAATGGNGSGSYSFSAGSSTGCSVSGTTVSVTNASGTCDLTATRAGDADYNDSAASAPFAVTLVKASQTTPSVTGPGSITYGATGTATATSASSTGAYVFSAGSSTGCSVTGTTVSVLDASQPCALTVYRQGDNNYLDSPASTPFTVTLAKASQEALAVTAAPNPVAYGNTAALSASGGSTNGTVTFSAGSSTGCSVAGSTLSVTDPSGTCAVTATMAGNNDYNPVTSTSLTVTLQKASQATVTVTGPTSVTYGTTGTATATGGSGTGAYSFSAGASTGCSVSGTTVTVTNVSGSCVLTATRAGDDNYLDSAASAPLTVALVKATATVTLGNLTQTFTGSSLTPTATTTPSGLSITWTNAPQTNVGTYTVTATVDNPNYTGSASGTFDIKYGFPGLLAPYAPPAAGVAYKVRSTVPLKWQYTDASGNVLPSSNAAPTVLIYGMGACGGTDTTVITVSDSGNSGYQYDPTTNTWQFNWKTTGLSSGSCYDIYIQSGQSGQRDGGFPIELK
jgi:uncharacterized protein YjiK